MSVSDTVYYEQFGEIKFGEIENYCLEEHENSLESYWKGDGFLYPTFLDDFGEFKFGEIENPYLQDFDDFIRL